MREIVLDTETTGLDVNSHRIIEIGCVELNNHHLQGEGLNFNQFEIDHCHEVARLPG
ncbi:exonuclease domain-containing protein [Wolbachia endosymbiont of Laodelphax striatellus]|uniref:exonuclease domain-containing protein n=1 Tax=Wolbachia endosymbiont of Laodelphax striatellus TaxID=368602 RepID=UPI00210185A8|nr:exonuclease domain-containing protein [Wolbachia endosymbiont of Laodelphax striatellus]